MRIGHGFDSHRFVDGRRLVLGGVTVPFPRGLSGHSDADVLVHAVIDAVIGAMGWGDIGSHFPDTEGAWKGADSMGLLKTIVDRVDAAGGCVTWVDATIVAQEPRLLPYVSQMKEQFARGGIDSRRVNIKAKTAEGMGPVGRGEGIEAFAVCLVDGVALMD